MTLSTPPSTRILLIEQNPGTAATLQRMLEPDAYLVNVIADSRQVGRMLAQNPYHLVIASMDQPGWEGFELLRLLREQHPQLAVIIYTAFGTIDSAVEAIRQGAFDYLTQPIVPEELRLIVQRALQQQALVTENLELREQLQQQSRFEQIVGQDYRMAKIFDLIDTIADARITVLITGDSGTGKSLLARAIHRHSSRRDRPFIEVSCGALPETLLESELFGHVQGSFTGAISNKEGKFQAADGGTLFLDEIAAASPALQLKLLRALQERQFEPVGSNTTRTVDVRVILATNVDLPQEVAAGRFRQDLFYRINVMNIVLPRLAERLGDIPLLARHFIERHRQELCKEITGLDDQALQALQSYHWPGNIRELENVIERAMVFAKDRLIRLYDLPPHLIQLISAAPTTAEYQHQSLEDALREPEKQIISAALQAHQWNRQATAEALQINRTTLYKKMKRYGLLSPGTA
ncbi:MAG: Regulatory protein AtoC [Phycisphaerae bacterium]|nr:Regulatory protein AtoC [Phycisphaerae bacterium]